MKYVGSKNRYAKDLLPIILKDRQPGQWYVEPFVGGFNMIDKVTGNRIGNDSHYYLIELFKAVQNGWIPPDKVSEDEWIRTRDYKEKYPSYLVGFIGYGCSYSGKWFGGYARGNDNDNIPRNYAGESKRNLLKQVPGLQGIKITNSNYLDLDIPPNSIIYCDPPYKDTTKYRDNFDHEIFWGWIEGLKGHQVFVSEYHAPNEFMCIWEKKVNNTLVRHTGAKQGIERLFKMNTIIRPKTKLIYGDAHTIVVGSSHIKNRIKALLSARPEGFQFMPLYKLGHWDGYTSLYKDDKFPTGLLDLVEDELEKNSIEYELEDHNDPGNIPLFTKLNGLSLRSYQLEAAQTFLQYHRGVLQMAPNAGKTAILASIIASTGYRALIIVPSRALLHQTSADLKKLLGVNVNLYGSGHKDLGDITVTTAASLKHIAERANELKNNSLVAIDECHHTRSDSIFDNITKIPGRYRLGLSGTALTYDRLSDMKLIGATGSILYVISNKDLIDSNYSVPPKIIFIAIDNEYYEKIPYQDIHKAAIVNNHYRNQIIADLMSKCDGPVLTMVEWIKHANQISGWLGNDTVVVTGKDSDSEIKMKMVAFGETTFKMIATPVFKEGVNIPEIRTLILAGGGKSHIAIIQKIGRGLRKSDGKNNLIVYDFLDDCSKVTLKHSEARYKLYRDEGFEITLETE